MTRDKIGALLRKKSSVKLDLGCGNAKQEGYLGVDFRKTPSADLVFDLTRFPWPLPANIASEVVMSHFWEHILPTKTMRFMEELHRVCKHNALVFISAPYAMGYRFCQDPTHCNPTNDSTFAYWDPVHASGLWGVYQPKPFHLISFELTPVSGDRDFNAVLKCCKTLRPTKADKSKLVCSHLRTKSHSSSRS